MADVTLKTIMDYFGYSAGDFMKEWKKLTDQDKADLKAAFADGSLTY